MECDNHHDNRPTMTNSSQITPMVSVDDVERAVAFYKHLGFHSIAEIKGPNGEIIRAILQLNTGSLIHVMPAHALLRKANMAL